MRLYLNHLINIPAHALLSTSGGYSVLCEYFFQLNILLHTIIFLLCITHGMYAYFNFI